MLRGRGRGRGRERGGGGVYFGHHGMGSRVRPTNTNTRFIHASSLTAVDTTSSKIPSKMLSYSPTTTADATPTTTTIKHHLDKNILNTAGNKEDYFVRNRNRNKNAIDDDDDDEDDTTSSSRRFPLLGQWFRQRFASTSSSSPTKDDTKRHHRRQLRVRDTASNDDKNVKSGTDRDDYGCINSAGYSWCESQSKCIRVWNATCDCVPSAGYVWCESTNECIRPWETTCPISTTASTSTISTNSSMMILGNSNDDHNNCLLSAGYFWCESTNECIRPWETTCPSTTTATTTTTTTTSPSTNSDMVLANIEE
ncbi:hypothetical protein FRACYDRAFT_254454 [Fragilariopsis cylindrus CCMP1102]|uniref:Uncharacterized protein n=1 Tax=Fragilariopsis cylindrus CCMP1102 TaxID=635003 RepID=A0A1E7EKM1_9STRA|nr:hypothetical protein FRACYDRAFT_254454 [Fragilariopsis cylindrus CCMP1102]|eukprot:OEU06438.1 hypothetical protein FRACYDRAFT_254454 [Fragilariopsis cylindrus CCMP1102]